MPATEYPTVVFVGRYAVVLTDPDGLTYGITDADAAGDLIDDGYDLTAAQIEAERLDIVDSCQDLRDSIDWHLDGLDLDLRATQIRLAAILKMLTD